MEHKRLINRQITIPTCRQRGARGYCYNIDFQQIMVHESLMKSKHRNHLLHAGAAGAFNQYGGAMDRICLEIICQFI